MEEVPRGDQGVIGTPRREKPQEGSLIVWVGRSLGRLPGGGGACAELRRGLLTAIAYRASSLSE